jgi:hypothetical protein
MTDVFSSRKVFLASLRLGVSLRRTVNLAAIACTVAATAAPPEFHLESPYRFGAYQHKVQLHCHSTNSHDGHLTPTQLMNAYAARGYAAVAITDHDGTTSFPSLTDPGGHDIIFITGVEYSVSGSHMLGINIQTFHMKGAAGATYRPFQSTQATIEGGMSYLCHPWDLSVDSYGWSTARVIAASHRYTGMEILTAGTYINSNERDFPYKVDAALIAGKEIQLIAVDDFHSSPESNMDRGFVVINSDIAQPELSRDDVVYALRTGNFFAAGRTSTSFPTPPRFTDIRIDGHTIQVNTNRPCEIEFITFNNNYYTRRQGRPAFAWKSGTTMAASYTAAYDDVWIRIKVTTYSSSGPAYAWSNPIYVRDGVAPAPEPTPRILAVDGKGVVQYLRAKGDAAWQIRLSADLQTWATPAAFGISTEETIEDAGAYKDRVVLTLDNITEPVFLRLVQE